MRRLFPAFALVACLVFGQEALWSPGELTYSVSDYRPEITLTSSVALVQAEAVVRNGSHAAVDGLTRDDFEVRDDGVPRRITGFEVERTVPAGGAADAAAKPRYVTFFVDDLNTAIYGINNARRGALQYLDAGTPPNQWMSVATSSGLVTQEFTQDRDLIEAALNRIVPSPVGCNATQTMRAYSAIYSRVKPDKRGPAPIMGSVFGPLAGPNLAPDASVATNTGGGVAVRAGGGLSRTKALHPADKCPPAPDIAHLESGETQARMAYNAIVGQLQYLGQQPGDRVFLWASYGIFSFDSDKFGDTVERISDAAIHNHITINSLDTQGVGELLTMAADLDAMDDLSADTGGRIFFGDNGFAEGIRELVEPPAVAYLLSFEPAPPQRDGKLHAIAVTLVHGHGLTVASRTGYFASAPEEPGLGALRDAVRQAVLAQTTTTVLPANALVTTRAGAGVAVDFQLRTAGLPLLAAGGLHTNAVLAVAELFDAQGKFVEGQIGQLDLRLKSESVSKFRQTPAVPLKLTLHAPAGSYRLRTVIGEAHTGLLSASNTDVVVH